MFFLASNRQFLWDPRTVLLIVGKGNFRLGFDRKTFSKGNMIKMKNVQNARD